MNFAALSKNTSALFVKMKMGANDNEKQKKNQQRNEYMYERTIHDFRNILPPLIFPFVIFALIGFTFVVNVLSD